MNFDEFLAFDEFGYYADEGLSKLMDAARSMNIPLEIEKLIENLSKPDFGMNNILSDILFKHFSDEDIRETFAKTNIPLEHWQYVVQDEFSQDNLERLTRFAIKELHDDDPFKAIEHYDERVSVIILSALAL